jgi:hypothetical protein
MPISDGSQFLVRLLRSRENECRLALGPRSEALARRRLPAGGRNLWVRGLLPGKAADGCSSR